MVGIGIGGGLNGGLTFALDFKTLTDGSKSMEIAIVALATVKLGVVAGEKVTVGSIMLCASGELAKTLIANRIQGPGIGGWFSWNTISNIQFECGIETGVSATAGGGVCAKAAIDAGIGIQATVGVTGCVGICFGEGIEAGVSLQCGLKLQITASPTWNAASGVVSITVKNNSGKQLTI